MSSAYSAPSGPLIPFYRDRFWRLVVRDVAIDLVIMQVLYIRFVGEASISGDDGTCLINALGNAQLLVAPGRRGRVLHFAIEFALDKRKDLTLGFLLRPQHRL